MDIENISDCIVMWTVLPMFQSKLHCYKGIFECLMILGGQNAFGIYVISHNQEYATSLDIVFICIWVEWVWLNMGLGRGKVESEIMFNCNGLIHRKRVCVML